MMVLAMIFVVSGLMEMKKDEPYPTWRTDIQYTADKTLASRPRDKPHMGRGGEMKPKKIIKDYSITCQQCVAFRRNSNRSGICNWGRGNVVNAVYEGEAACTSFLQNSGEEKQWQPKWLREEIGPAP